MVYRESKDNLYIFCDCGCDTIIALKKVDEELFISVSSSKFYSEQNTLYSKIFDILKELIILKKHKRNVLSECIINDKEDIKKLKDFLEDILPNLDSENTYINSSQLVVENISQESFECYAVEILGTSRNLSNILFHRHRRYEIVATKKEVMKMIKYCKKALK